MDVSAKISVMIFFATTLIISCGQPDATGSGTDNSGNIKEELIEANKGAVKTEDQHIDDFIKRRGWNMQTSGTGLRYMITEQGNGEKAETGRIATLEFKTRLITGDIIYSSETNGLKEFEIGRGGVESGLEEAIMMMRVGDKGNFILPSYLAWGLTGDGNLVPPKSTLIYELKLIDLK